MHRYATTVTWTGNLGTGTSDYRNYSRASTIAAGGKAPIDASSDPAFRGEGARWNPEELLVASLSTCHMLWYLHLAAVAGVVVTEYRDEADGTMEERSGAGRFVRVTLRPRVTIAPGSDAGRAGELHRDAHAQCFIANSVNFPVDCEPATLVDGHGLGQASGRNR
ncbi:MAG: OsmC family protein [Candidatus Tumulicola sp.]